MLALSFAIANTVSANFSQGFEVNNNGWNVFGGTLDATRVPSGTNGINSHTGGFHAEIAGNVQLCDGTFSAATKWGGYSRPFPLLGYRTDIWVYLNVNNPANANDMRFDWIASAVTDGDCGFTRDFAFNFGWYKPRLV